MEATHTWEQLKAYVDSFGLAQDLRYQLDGNWYTVWLSHDGPPMSMRAKKGTPEADGFEAGYKAGIVQTVRPRQHPDGSYVTKGDTGGPGDDPKMHTSSLQIGGGSTDFVWCEANHKLFGLIVQVRDAEPTDFLEAVVGVAVSGVVPDGQGGFLAIGTVIGTFGTVAAPQPKSVDANGSPRGWGEREVRFDTSKTIPSYGKAGVKYTSASGGLTRYILVDFMRQVPEGT